MSTRVVLTAIRGPLAGEAFTFTAHTVCTVGRAHDCSLHLPLGQDLTASRRHCRLVIDPPSVLVRDLGSRNGTFVNGTRIAPPADPSSQGSGGQDDFELHDGDALRVGESVFLVSVEEVPAEREDGDVPSGEQPVLCG